MCHGCSLGEIVVLHLGKEKSTNKPITIPVGTGRNGLSYVGLFGPQEAVHKFFAYRLMMDIKPPLAVAFLDSSSGRNSVHRQWDRYEMFPHVSPAVPVLAVGDMAALEVLRNSDTCPDAIIVVDDRNRVTVEMNRQRFVLA